MASGEIQVLMDIFFTEWLEVFLPDCNLDPQTILKFNHGLE